MLAIILSYLEVCLELYFEIYIHFSVKLTKNSCNLGHSEAGSANGVGSEANRKRAVRLQKNREAARECRRKKKEYIKCLENRVAVLEVI